MRKVLYALCCTAICILTIVSCQKNQSNPGTQTQQISQDVLNKISQLGFTTDGAFADEDGNYVVEGDIVVTPQLLNSTPSQMLLRVANSEQYRTTNLVKSLPRVITVSLSSGFSSTYVQAADDAIARYNALNLQLTFKRVASGGNIAMTKVNTRQYLASSGFPTSGGDPYGQIKVSVNAIGNQPRNTIATILAHEMGHCIGFRHTDYMDRSYSCGGSHVNEGSSGVGAINIPGTPTGPDANSWMLSCIGSGQNRPFNANDKVALNYLY
jgi:Dual-action HEIGH metallo-peptidase